MKLTNVPSPAPNHTWRASGSSSEGASLDDRQPEHVAIERDRALEVAADRRDVVQPAQPHALVVRHAAEG